MPISDKQRRMLHAKMKGNPYKDAAMSMSRSVADDGILSRVGELRNAKLKAGEAAPEPMGSQAQLTHRTDTGFDKKIDNTHDGLMGTKTDTTEQYDDEGGSNASGHHKYNTKQAMNEALKKGAAGEHSPTQEEAPDQDEPAALSHVDRIARSFTSPSKRKRVIDVGSPSKSDFGSLHARSMNKLRSKE